MGKVQKSEIASLDNPALVNNFVKRLPQRFRIKYHDHALYIDNTWKFNDLLKFITRAIRDAEHNPEKWVNDTGTSKSNPNGAEGVHFGKT